MAVPTEYPILSYRSHGPAVTELREKLTVLGFYAPEPGRGDREGEFGAVTDAAVRVFQTASGFRSDGVVDDAIWDALVNAAADAS